MESNTNKTLNDYLNSDTFKKYIDSPNYNKILRYLIYYDLLFNEDATRINDLIKRINDKNIDTSYLNIITNKLLSKNDSKKKIYTKVLSRIGNIKYEIKTSNNTDYFKKVTDLLSKYSINTSPRDKKIVSNNLDKILDIYPILDSNISSIADLAYGTNKVLYSSKEYYDIRTRFQLFLKNNKVSTSDTNYIVYYLDKYYLSTKNEIILSNNIEISPSVIEEIYNHYKNSLSSFLLDLINNKKERKALNSINIKTISLPYEEDTRILESYLLVQESINNTTSN